MHTTGVLAPPCAYSTDTTTNGSNTSQIKSAARHVRSWIAKYSPECIFVVQNERWNTLTAVAGQAEASGDYELAESLLMQALDETAIFSLRDPRVLQTLGQTADLYFRWGNVPEAKKYFHMEATIAHVIFGNYHVTSASSLSRLGTAYYSDESYLAAELCFRQALQVHVALTGMDSWAAREAAQNLAFALEKCSQTGSELSFEPHHIARDFAPELADQVEAENIVFQFISLLNKASEKEKDSNSRNNIGSNMSNEQPSYFKKKRTNPLTHNVYTLPILTELEFTN